MSWLTDWMNSPRKILASGKKESPTPEGMWLQCPGCKETLYNKELHGYLMVCPRCNEHLRIEASKRAEFLFDEASYQEFDLDLKPADPLGFKDQKRYKDRVKDAVKKAGNEDAMRNYLGEICAQKASVSIFDFAFMGGSMGSVVGEKIARGMERAVENRCPYLLITASGGARMQEGILSLMQMAKTSSVANQLKDQKLPFVCLLTDPTMGGVSASVAWLGDVILAEPGALIGFAGPRVIQETVGEKLPEGFQRAEFLQEHGLIDAIVNRGDQRDYLSMTFRHLMQRPFANKTL
ncbi:MAG: acetyl-CoA carboxylase carboxyltransferase subunit beta [Zetaproteobacteria bacterium]|nr:acetyl-CoA carboxylase carboxyltransferase subunit beta [Zetaproteobacteria bacterium]